MKMMSRRDSHTVATQGASYLLSGPTGFPANNPFCGGKKVSKKQLTAIRISKSKR